MVVRQEEALRLGVMVGEELLLGERLSEADTLGERVEVIETVRLRPTNEGGADVLKEMDVVLVNLKVRVRLTVLQLVSVRVTDAVRQEVGQCVGEGLKLPVMEAVREREALPLVLSVPEELLEEVCVAEALKEALAVLQTLELAEGLAEAHSVAELHGEGVAVPERSLLSVAVAHSVRVGVALRVWGPLGEMDRVPVTQAVDVPVLEMLGEVVASMLPLIVVVAVRDEEREAEREAVVEEEGEVVAGMLSTRVLLGVWVEVWHIVSMPEPESKVLRVLEKHAVALAVGRGVGVPVPQADPEFVGGSVPEALVEALFVSVACWEAVAAATVGVPVPEAHWLGVSEEALREDWPEAENVPLPEPLPVTVSVPVVHTLELVEGDAVPVPLLLAL